MAFKRLLAGLGIGGASVETVLHVDRTPPGGTVAGEVRIEGGSVEQRIERLTVGLTAKVEVEYKAGGEDHESLRSMDIVRREIGGELAIQPEQVVTVPFELDVPLETPVTATSKGTHLKRMNIGVNTRLHIAGGLDPGDLDPVMITPLPAQDAVLKALRKLGFRFKQADVEKGTRRGTRQRLPFYQEIEYYAPSGYRGLNELELSFFADERGMDVVLELDKKPGLLSEGRDSFHRFEIDHRAVDGQDWAAYLHKVIDDIAGRRRIL